MWFPVHVKRNVEVVVLPSVRLFTVFSAVKYTQLAEETVKHGTPGLKAVVGHVRQPHGTVIHQGRLLLHMEHGVLLSELNYMLYKFMEAAVGI